MAFEAFVKSVYEGPYKTKPIFTSVKEAIHLRVQKQEKERRNRRCDAFMSNRVIESDNGSIQPSPNLEEKPPRKKEGPSDPSKEKLLQWKQERMKRKELKPPKKPPFKVGVVKHTFFPFQQEIFHKCKHTVVESQASNQRVTRATTRSNARVMQQATHSHKTQVEQKSFAPANAMCHLPKVTTIERQKSKLKYTPTKPKSSNSARVLAANLIQNPSSLKDTKKPPAMTKTNVAIESKRTANVPMKNKQVLFRATRSKAVDLDESVKIKEESPVKSPRGRRTPINVSKTSDSGVSQTSGIGGDLFSCPEPGTPRTDLMISSPYVTVGRGKSSRQQESMAKIKFGYSQMSPEKSAQYFRMQLDREVARLSELCTTWRTYEQEHGSELVEDSMDLISLAVGQTQLLINKKFEQFRGLIVQCENMDRREGEGVVTVQDLRGFWDMIYMQVENVDIRFNRLAELKSKSWREDEVTPQVTKGKRKLVGKKKSASSTSSSGLKAMILAARMKSNGASSVADAPAMNHLAPNNTITFNGGFFSITSPVKNRHEEELIRTPSKRVSMLQTVVASEAKKRLSTKSQPDCVISSIDLNKTPGKSILKTPGTNKKSSTKNPKKTIKVLFMGESSDEDVKNKFKARRSKRLSITKANQENKENGTDEDILLLTPARKSHRSRQTDDNQSPVIHCVDGEDAGEANLIDLGEPTPLLKSARSRRIRLTRELSQLSGPKYPGISRTVNNSVECSSIYGSA